MSLFAPAVLVRRTISQTASRRRRRLAVELLEPRMCLSLDVPAFSSLPGANHTIYLDFDGHVTSGTTWNTGYYNQDPINSPAWSTDGDRLNFTDDERTTIGNIWRRVAEDFSPFNVNVTTVEPPINDLRKGEVSGDTKWGVRAVVTIETTTVRCGCGGIAYIGSFNDFYDEPVFVYNSSESGVAEAISHEVGHSLYLAHDGLVGADGVAKTADDVEYYSGHGSGNTSWAPIMGNSYNRNVTTWDKGEYYNSNNGGSNANYSNGPDDLSVMTTNNGFGYRADDHGGTSATATPLSASGTAVFGNGIIGSRTDSDMFSFATAAGVVTLGISPIAVRPNLDIQADLFDGAGNLIATSNPASDLNASFSIALNTGTYYLRIDGIGYGTPSSSTPTGYTDYASIGQYSITGTVVDPGGLPTLTVDDVTVSESAGNAAFVVRLNGTITETVTVTYGTSNGSATAGNDYTGVGPATLTFSPGGPATQTVNVSLLNDGVSETSESFNLVLSNVSANAIIADATGVASIANDDAEWRINDVSITEGNVTKKGSTGYTTGSFTVSLAHPVDHSVSASYATGAIEDTATAGVDYQQASGSVTISTAQSSTSIPITVIGDNSQESNETFSVLITSSDGTVSDGKGVGTIVDNDSGNGNGNGKGGGPRNGPNGANYEGDFTVIGHTDLAEPAEWIVNDVHDHSGLHDHGSHEHGSHTHSHSHALPNDEMFGYRQNQDLRVDAGDQLGYEVEPLTRTKPDLVQAKSSAFRGLIARNDVRNSMSVPRVSNRLAASTSDNVEFSYRVYGSMKKDQSTNERKPSRHDRVMERKELADEIVIATDEVLENTESWFS